MLCGAVRFLVASTTGIEVPVATNLMHLFSDGFLAPVGRFGECEEGKQEDQTYEGAGNFVNDSPIMVDGDQTDEMVLVGSQVIQ